MAQTILLDMRCGLTGRDIARALRALTPAGLALSVRRGDRIRQTMPPVSGFDDRALTRVEVFASLALLQTAQNPTAALAITVADVDDADRLRDRLGLGDGARAVA